MSKPACVMDCETYVNYFLVAFRNITTGTIRQFELFGEEATFTVEQHKQIRAIMKACRLVTFNGQHYDLPVLFLALSGKPCVTLKECSDKIIIGGLQYWHVEKHYGFTIPRNMDHVDLINVAPGTASLKIYGGRLHTRKMQDLPLPPDSVIMDEQRPMLRSYNLNDLDSTIDLHNSLLEQLALREKMSKEYGIDLMSKSDAQVAEAVIKKSMEDLTGIRLYKPGSRAGEKFRYKVPEWVRFTTPALQDVLERIRNTWFVIDMNDQVLLPDSIAMSKLRIGNSKYQMGIGGLHSTESCIAHHAIDGYRITDIDMTSYYPYVILGQGLYPAHMGEKFLDVYRGIVNRRIAAKREGNKVVAESLKITINGSFGKFGNKWSILYSPELMVQVTVTGQLAILMLIEALEGAGISVVSGNTDGIVTKYHEDDRYMLDSIVDVFQMTTGFNTEETEYTDIYSRDVNSYLAIKPDGKFKAKGALALEGLQKNPTNTICIEAVINLLTGGELIEDTVNQCEDVRKFVTIRQVKGGAIDHHGRYLGKAVRWYYAKPDEDDWMGASCVMYKSNMNLVARSEGGKPLMELPDNFAVPADLDRGWYINEAQSILKDIGVTE